MSESRVDRIRRMEAYLDEARQAMDDLHQAVIRYVNVQKGIKKLEEYYTCGKWMKDFEADEAGKLPADLKRGVLTEDAINDLLDDNRDMLERLGFEKAGETGRVL
ncbi:MAG: DUF4298 domain-containing protein [Lachnospiraceae bacterium]|nr:DUF4298 domain-containing protein [Lachnospiraceae bacterium]